MKARNTSNCIIILEEKRKLQMLHFNARNVQAKKPAPRVPFYLLKSIKIVELSSQITNIEAAHLSNY
jgi:hypothetical protein